MNEIQEVTPEQALKIIQTREPMGLFMALCQDGKYVGIDNSTGDAWTEDFKTKARCVRWLRHG